MPYDITDPAAAHRLQLEGREKLTVSGVEDVERFDDQCIVLRTGAGVLVVSGESLHIGKLSLDGGELHVDGRIDALTYEDAPGTRGGGAALTAVQNGRYYEIPGLPYDWMSSPPSVNRVLGIWWLGNLLYPELYDYDMVQVAQEYYGLFWHYDLTEEEARQMLSRSTLK